jgi:hypothetical protein
MLLVLASNKDKNATAFVSRLGSEQAALVSCDDLCRPGWRFHLANSEKGRVVADGKVIPLSQITGVLTLRPHVFEVELIYIAKQDRSYVASEINSFLMAWLSSLECPVINRPVGNCLSGPSLHQEEWVNLAASIGIPVQEVHRVVRLDIQDQKHTDGDNKTVDTQVTVVGERWIGEVDDNLGAKAVHLARAAGAVLLQIWFEKEKFIGASAFPPLDRDPVINAVLEHLERMCS